MHHREQDLEYTKNTVDTSNLSDGFEQLPGKQQDIEGSTQDIAVHVKSKSQTEWELSVRFYNGFTLNSRVPETKRLQLVTPKQSWKTKDFFLGPDAANLYINEAIPSYATLTAYICRADRCKKVMMPVKTNQNQ